MELRKGLNKISNPVVAVARNIAAVVADSNKAVVARNLAADMPAGGSNNREQLELAHQDFGDIFLQEYFLGQIRGGRRGMDRRSNKKSQKIKFQQQTTSKKNYALWDVGIETLKLIISCLDRGHRACYQLE